MSASSESSSIFLMIQKENHGTVIIGKTTKEHLSSLNADTWKCDEVVIEVGNNVADRSRRAKADQIVSEFHHNEFVILCRSSSLSRSWLLLSQENAKVDQPEQCCRADRLAPIVQPCASAVLSMAWSSTISLMAVHIKSANTIANFERRYTVFCCPRFRLDSAELCVPDHAGQVFRVLGVQRDQGFGRAGARLRV